jgi:hypothetical protein
MDWSDQPAGQPAHSPPADSPFAAPASFSPSTASDTSEARGRSTRGGARRTIATALLAVGLLTVGGVAVVLAADPSATPAPSGATTPSTDGNVTAPGTGTTRPQRGAGTDGVAPDGIKAPCPDKAGTGSGTTPDASAAPATPTTPDPTVTPDPTTTPSAEL